jgi:hypothetical protein
VLITPSSKCSFSMGAVKIKLIAKVDTNTYMKLQENYFFLFNKLASVSWEGYMGHNVFPLYKTSMVGARRILVCLWHLYRVTQ